MFTIGIDPHKGSQSAPVGPALRVGARHVCLRCEHGGPDCLAGSRESCAPPIGQPRDDVESPSARSGVAWRADSDVVDVGVAVGDLDGYFALAAVQRQFGGRGAVKDRVRHQFTGNGA